MIAMKYNKFFNFCKVVVHKLQKFKKIVKQKINGVPYNAYYFSPSVFIFNVSNFYKPCLIIVDT